MSGNLKVPQPVVRATGRVGLPPALKNSLGWRANSHPAVQAVDARIAAARAANAPVADVNKLKAEREVAVQLAIRELVG